MLTAVTTSIASRLASGMMSLISTYLKFWPAHCFTGSMSLSLQRASYDPS